MHVPPTDREREILRQWELFELACRTLATAERELREAQVLRLHAQRQRANATGFIERSRDALRSLGVWDEEAAEVLKKFGG